MVRQCSSCDSLVVIGGLDHAVAERQVCADASASEGRQWVRDQPKEARTRSSVMKNVSRSRVRSR